MELISFVSGAISSTILLAIAAFLSKTWIEKRIEFSIAHEYDRKIQSAEHEHELRMKAALVAELLAVWALSTNLSADTVTRLNQLSFEAFLWLPESIARDLSNTLAHEPGADGVKTILIKVRKHLLNADDQLTAHEIVSFRSSTP
ncbi:hypothetical protein [Janthinobacterium lividum]|uniref:hypothetical protein n=1 Tax=Janthinobacterium lividum TaxID=29581 RepID=UPI0014094266|nr:hypothetical protein [Janthinobacterium lividum]NHQ93321.1 hypothetical protein [Janthinobacterium lividum]